MFLDKDNASVFSLNNSRLFDCVHVYQNTSKHHTVPWLTPVLSRDETTSINTHSETKRRTRCHCLSATMRPVCLCQFGTKHDRESPSTERLLLPFAFSRSLSFSLLRVSRCLRLLSLCFLCLPRLLLLLQPQTSFIMYQMVGCCISRIDLGFNETLDSLICSFIC